MNEVARENARRLTIFDAGRAANGQGRSYHANPYHNGLDWEIWSNGWWFAENSGDRERYEARRVNSWSAVVLVIAFLIIAAAQLLR